MRLPARGIKAISAASRAAHGETWPDCTNFNSSTTLTFLPQLSHPLPSSLGPCTCCCSSVADVPNGPQRRCLQVAYLIQARWADYMHLSDAIWLGMRVSCWHSTVVVQPSQHPTAHSLVFVACIFKAILLQLAGITRHSDCAIS